MCTYFPWPGRLAVALVLLVLVSLTPYAIAEGIIESSVQVTIEDL